MAIEEILGGLKNAIERGENPQDAAQTFLNSGYPEKDVMEALRQLTTEIPKVLEIPRRILLTEKQTSETRSAPAPSEEIPLLPKAETKKDGKNLILLSIGVVGAILLGVVAALLVNLRSS